MAVLILRVLGQPLDTYEQAEGVLALAPHLGSEDIGVFTAGRFATPTRFDDVVVGVEGQGAVDLFPRKVVRQARLHVEQHEEVSQQHFKVFAAPLGIGLLLKGEEPLPLLFNLIAETSVGLGLRAPRLPFGDNALSVCQHVGVLLGQ